MDPSCTLSLALLGRSSKGVSTGYFLIASVIDIKFGSASEIQLESNNLKWYTSGLRGSGYRVGYAHKKWFVGAALFEEHWFWVVDWNIHFTALLVFLICCFAFSFIVHRLDIFQQQILKCSFGYCKNIKWWCTVFGCCAFPCLNCSRISLQLLYLWHVTPNQSLTSYFFQSCNCNLALCEFLLLCNIRHFPWIIRVYPLSISSDCNFHTSPLVLVD